MGVEPAINLDDREAVANFVRSGESGKLLVIKAIIIRYKEQIRRYAGDKYGCWDEAVIQDAFVKIWQRIGTYRPEDASVFAFACMITRSVVIDHLRKLKRRPEQAVGDVYDLDRQRRSRGHKRNGRALNPMEDEGDGESDMDEKSPGQLTDRIKASFLSMLPPLQREVVDAYRPGEDWAADHADEVLGKKYGMSPEVIVELHPEERKRVAARARRNWHEILRKFREFLGEKPRCPPSP